MKFVKFVLILVVLAALILTGIYFYSGVLFKETVNTAGPKILGVPVSLNDVDIKLHKGKFRIESLTVENPEEFKSEYAMHVEDFNVQLTPASVLSDVIHIQDITLNNAVLISDGLTANNHQQIIENIKNIVPQSEKEEETEPAEEDKTEKKKSEKQLIIDHFAFTNSKLIIQVDGEVITKVEFPNIELNNIGTKGASITAAEAATQIYTAIMSETSRVLTINEDVIEALAKAKLKKFGIDDLKDLKDPKKLLDDPDKVNKIIGSLLNPKD